MSVQTSFVSPVDPRYPSCHASTLVALGPGLVAAWYAGSREGGEDVVILTASCLAPADAWSEPRVAVATPGRSLGNPVLFVGPGGALELLFVTLEGEGWETGLVRARTSHDGGATWADDRPVTTEPGFMVRNKPIALEDGTLLLPVYDERDESSIAFVSPDGGATWTPRGRMSGPGLLQPTLARVQDGVVAFFRRGVRQRTKRVFRALSRDQGRSWSEPAPTALPNPNASLDVVSLGPGRPTSPPLGPGRPTSRPLGPGRPTSPPLGPSDELVLAFNDDPGERTPLALALSEDAGLTWWEPHLLLEEGPGEYSYPAIVLDPAGRIHVTYTWRRERIRHVVLEAGELRRRLA